MAYQIQQRRDTLANWNAVNPVLADSEIGFILDLDANGKQKSSLFKIGDGKTAWNNLPLFGWSGNIYNKDNAWKSSDLDTSIASQQAVLNKITEKISESEGKSQVVINDIKSELLKKIDKDNLVQYIYEQTGEFDESTPIDEKLSIWADQIISRATLLVEFEKIWADIETNSTKNEEFVKITEAQLATLKTFAEEYGPIIDELQLTVEDHTKKIDGWEEEVDGETIKHDGLETKISKLNDKISNIISEEDFALIKDFKDPECLF